MKIIQRKIFSVVLISIAFLWNCSLSNAQNYNANFDNVSDLITEGWIKTNLSTNANQASWSQGDNSVFNSYNGSNNSYIFVNFRSGSGNTTVSNWFISPETTFSNGDEISFYTRCYGSNYPDHLELRFSPNGSSVDAGTSATDVGDFTELLIDINPSLTIGGYPTSWTFYTATISGLSGPTNGRMAFHYSMVNGGTNGSNGDYVGIDELNITHICPHITPTTLSTTTIVGDSYSEQFSTTGAAGSDSYTLASGSLPTGLSLSLSGLISGTSTATGLYPFIVSTEYSDTNVCQQSIAASIYVDCYQDSATLSTFPQFCSNDASYTLIEGAPAGGTYSGTGVSAGEFDPSSGTQIITYEYTDVFGCVHSTSDLLTVNTAPSVSMTLSAVCDNEGLITLTEGTPSGGTYSGTGITGSQFDPSVGTSEITYEYTDGNSCTVQVSDSLTVLLSSTSIDAQTACDSYVWMDGNTYTSSNNTATFVTTNAVGCDSTITLDLTINYSSSSIDVQTACNSYTWLDGNTYTSSNNTATFVTTNAVGCDSTITLDLTINYSSSSIDVQTACNSYTWLDGNTYTSSNNTATFVTTNAVGCDSTITLDLTINYSSSSIDAQTACNSYTWLDGNTYTSSNNSATFVTTNATGCDSTITLDLAINYSSSSIDVQTACNSYTWLDGNTYTSSNNTATFVTTNATGCDSTITLDLTINNSSSSIDVQTACNSHTWLDGNTYTSSNNTATFVLTNATGCDSTITLDLTINYSSSSIDVQTACNSYTWLDGNTYTSSNNTATFVTTNAVGCDSTITLDLTINTSSSSVDLQTACDSYTWLDGNNYTSSNNTATFVTTNAAGCDSTITLDLTIENSSSSIDVQTACDSYVWLDGNTYTSSNNTATFVTTNATGCDSTITLDLTINNSSSSVDIQTACDSYTWLDGNTYTSSNNTATFVLTNTTGCDSTITLDLTINNTSSAIDVQTACDSYIWLDGNTYTSSNNTATFVLTNATGCDSTITLDLTINNTSSAIDVQTACGDFVWIDGNTYSSSNNTATFTLVNSVGCDSVVTLDLTILGSNPAISENEGILVSDATLGSYQWVDCDNNYSPIPGANSQLFHPLFNGSYAVIINQNQCADTSDCLIINYIGLDDIFLQDNLTIYPNPSSDGLFTIDFSRDIEKVEVLDMTGRIMAVNTPFNNKSIDGSSLSPGKYIVKCFTENGIVSKNVIINN